MSTRFGKYGARSERSQGARKVKVMRYNAQESAPTVQRLVQIAKDEKIPVVGISETEPPGATYQ